MITFSFIKVLANVKEENNVLNNKIIYVDAGHGGNDNGAFSGNILEDEINMKISGYLMEELINSGVYVLMSRTSDYDLASMYDKNRKKTDLCKRVNFINESKPDIFISIHLNSYPSSEVYGAQVFYQNNNESKVLAGAIQNKLNILTGKSRNVKFGDYYILNKSSPVGVLIECGFLSNDKEKKLLNPNSQQSSYQLQVC